MKKEEVQQYHIQEYMEDLLKQVNPVELKDSPLMEIDLNKFWNTPVYEESPFRGVTLLWVACYLAIIKNTPELLLRMESNLLDEKEYINWNATPTDEKSPWQGMTLPYLAGTLVMINKYLENTKKKAIFPPLLDRFIAPPLLTKLKNLDWNAAPKYPGFELSLIELALLLSRTHKDQRLLDMFLSGLSNDPSLIKRINWHTLSSQSGLNRGCSLAFHVAYFCSDADADYDKYLFILRKIISDQSITNTLNWNAGFTHPEHSGYGLTLASMAADIAVINCKELLECLISSPSEVRNSINWNGAALQSTSRNYYFDTLAAKAGSLAFIGNMGLLQMLISSPSNVHNRIIDDTFPAFSFCTDLFSSIKDKRKVVKNKQTLLPKLLYLLIEDSIRSSRNLQRLCDALCRKKIVPFDQSFLNNTFSTLYSFALQPAVVFWPQLYVWLWQGPQMKNCQLSRDLFIHIASFLCFKEKDAHILAKTVCVIAAKNLLLKSLKSIENEIKEKQPVTDLINNFESNNGSKFSIILHEKLKMWQEQKQKPSDSVVKSMERCCSRLSYLSK